MSIQAVSWVLDNSNARLGARLALISIANHADRQGCNSFPSYKTIGIEAFISERAAIDAVAVLHKGGHVSIEKGAGPRGQNRYKILGMQPGRGYEETSLPLSEAASGAGGEARGEVDRIPPFKEPFNRGNFKNSNQNQNRKYEPSQRPSEVSVGRLPDSWNNQSRYQAIEELADKAELVKSPESEPKELGFDWKAALKAGR